MSKRILTIFGDFLNFSIYLQEGTWYKAEISCCFDCFFCCSLWILFGPVYTTILMNSTINLKVTSSHQTTKSQNNLLLLYMHKIHSQNSCWWSDHLHSWHAAVLVETGFHLALCRIRWILVLQASCSHHYCRDYNGIMWMPVTITLVTRCSKTSLVHICPSSYLRISVEHWTG